MANSSPWRDSASPSRGRGASTSSDTAIQEPTDTAAPIPVEGEPGQLRPRARRSSAQLAAGLFASSFGSRPGPSQARSYYHHHQTAHNQHEPITYASQGVREQTAELASWALLDGDTVKSAASDDLVRFSSPQTIGDQAGPSSSARKRHAVAGTIEETSEPASPAPEDSPASGPASMSRYGQGSALTTMFRRSPPSTANDLKGNVARKRAASGAQSRTEPTQVVDEDEVVGEETPLLGAAKAKLHHIQDVERQQEHHRGRSKAIRQTLYDAKRKTERAAYLVGHPTKWDRKKIWQHGVVEPFQTLPAVFVALLLNVLDALSYGYILYPLGEKVFSQTGPDGISIYYVSTIVSQLVFSAGGTIFKGGVGSEMIEVVPFFHKMAYTILARVGEDNPQKVLATVTLSYAISSIITGLVFFLLGVLRLGSLVSFFPRSILTGCIGGVGLFLIITGIEVSARLPGNLQYTFDTLKELFSAHTAPLWLTPLALAVALLLIRYRFRQAAVTPLFFIFVFLLFYIVVVAAPSLSFELLRKKGWLFEKPSSDIPFYNFYTYYDFRQTDWAALLETIPTMFALTFFGILHVPINVPALALAVQEDDVNLNRELVAHGISNALSGFVGSVQNYLVYVNSVFFIRSGGNSRMAGFILAAATAGVWMAGPAVIGFIPIMIVGGLIFMLGIELVLESIWDTRREVERLEYCIIVAIVLVMGLYDFVVGIVFGIVLACLNYVVQTSRRSAIRATYTGVVAESTVRRHTIQRHFLREVGAQIFVMKLTGYLFFGTIVGVEKRARYLIQEESFRARPIRYLVLDLTQVTGLDFSAADAFKRMQRILQRRDIEMVLSGLSASGEVGKSLQMVGLLEDEDEDDDAAVKVFEDMNQALESCENELLLAFKQRSEALASSSQKESNVQQEQHEQPQSVPGSDALTRTSSLDPSFSSPRRSALHAAATTTLPSTHSLPGSRWSKLGLQQPLPLMLQAFADYTDRTEDFWFEAKPYFTQHTHPIGTVLYSRGDRPDGFYLLESGILRAEYELDQGRFSETIVAGTTCGELPFFAEQGRSATVVAEQDVVLWLLTREKWIALEKERPEVAVELLKIALKLTGERMRAVTSYVLVSAG